MSDLGISLEQAPAQVPNASTQPDAQANAQGAGSGPWAAQLAQFDEATRSSVDQFIRTSVQPYVTQLEQKVAAGKDAERLFTSLNEAPAETYLQITSELFGDEAVDAVIALLAGENNEGTTAPEAAANSSEPARDPEMEAFRQSYVADKRREAYDNEMSRVKSAAEAAGDTPVVDRLFHTFVSMADGDFDRAYDGYKQFYGEFKNTVTGEPAAVEGEQRVIAPSTLGSSTSTVTAPPVEKTYTSIDDALDDFFAETRPSAPPTVGAT